MFKSIQPSTIVGLCGSAIGIGLAVKAFRIGTRKITWSNNKPYTLKKLLSKNINYTIDNIISQDEILVYVTENELKTMSPEEKAELLKLFIIDEGTFKVRELTSEKIKWWFSRSPFEDCINRSIPFVMECIPNVINGTFTVKNLSSGFDCILEDKTQVQTDQAIMYAILSVASFLTTALLTG